MCEESPKLDILDRAYFGQNVRPAQTYRWPFACELVVC